MDNAVFWILLPVLASAGSGLLTYMVMSAHMQAVLATREKSLVEAETALAQQQMLTAARVKAGEETARRKALDDFLADVRVEQRHYVRETKTLLANRKHLVVQERIFFRNIPLSDWIERELLVETGGIVSAIETISPRWPCEGQLQLETPHTLCGSPVPAERS